LRCAATSTSSLSPLSLHDALPILQKLLARINTQHPDARPPVVAAAMWGATGAPGISSHASPPGTGTSPQPRLQEASLATPAARRSEEHTSELQSRFDLVCRLLLEK